jgi:hypothetical protein
MGVIPRPGMRSTLPGLLVFNLARTRANQRHLRLIVAVTLCLSLALEIAAAPKSVEEVPVPSPTGDYSVSLEWEDVGFIGILRMKVLDGGRLKHVVEMPEIDPQPGNLHWIDDEWAACESYLGPQASGFFYVHAPTGRGYLIEIRVTRAESDWEFSFSSNDRISSQTIDTVSIGHTSLFPVLVRDVPDAEVEFFSVSFCTKVSEAMTAFCDFRVKEGFRDMEILSDADIRQNLGALVMARVDGRYEVLYFPVNASSPREMLAKTRRQPVAKEAAAILEQPGAAEPVVRWTTTDGQYVVGLKSSPASASAKPDSGRILAEGRFQGVSDTAPQGPTAPAQGQGSVAKADSGSKGATTVTVRKPAESSQKASKHKPRRSRR